MTVTIPLPYRDAYAAGVYADLHGIDGGREAVVRLALRQLLDTDPRCDAVTAAEQAAKREARAAVLAEYQKETL